MAARRVLITGATGFIGSHLARHLLRKGFQVHVLCRRQSRFDRLEDVRHRLHVHPIGLADRARLRRATQAIAPTYVFHLAGAAMHGGAAACTEEIVRTNLLATINLIDACADVPYAGFVNTGDALEYGIKRRPARETDTCRPATLDGITKLTGTLFGRYAAMTTGKPLITLRLFSVFGPLDHPRRLVPQIITGTLASTPLRLSRADVTRDFLYVEDVANLYLTAARSARSLAGGVLNAGSGHPTTIAELVDIVGRLARKSLRVSWGSFPLAAHDSGCWVADVERTRKLLHWEPQFTLEAGLRTTLRRAREGRTASSRPL